MGLFDFFRRDAGDDVKLNPDGLREQITRLGYNANGYDIQVNDDTVTVRGAASSQEEKEKIAVALGNVKGVSRVDEQITINQPAQDTPGQPPSDQPGRQTRFHTVEKGDTLSAIAKTVYGDAGKYHTIFEANRPMLSSPDKIYPGQVLRIPPLD